MPLQSVLAPFTPDLTTRDAFVLVLPRAVTSTWFGLNPWMKPLPIPTWRTFTFPAGRYEVAWQGVQVTWRLVNGSGPWPFNSLAYPTGMPLIPAERQPAAIEEAHREYLALKSLADTGKVQALLAQLNRKVGF